MAGTEDAARGAGDAPERWRGRAGVIATAYLATAVVWIYASDRVADRLLDGKALEWAQTLKGWAFVVVTAWALYALVGRALRRTMEERRARSVAEEEAYTRGRLIELMTDAAPVYMSYVGPDGRYRWVNRKYEEWYRRPAGEIVGKSVEELQTAEAYGEMRAQVERALAGERVEYTARLREADGRERVFQVLYMPREGPGGERQGFFALVQEVTDRDGAERAMRESEARYRRIVETAGEGIWLVDAEWRTTFVNAAMARMIGHEPEEMSGRYLLEFMDEVAREECVRNMRRREHGIAEQHEFRLRHKDGRDVWTVMSTNSVQDEQGRFAGALAMVTDVTERRLAEAAAHAAEARFRATFEMAAVGIALTDLEGRYIVVNDAFAAMMGYAKEELVGRRFSDITHPEDLGRSEAGYEDAVAGRHGAYSLEKRYVRKDGGLVWAVVTPTLVRDAQGRGRYFVGILQDVTARKRAEQELRDSQRMFEQAQRVAQIGSWSIGVGESPLVWSEEMFRIFGVDAAVFRPTMESALEAVHPEDRESVREAGRLVSSGAGAFDLDHRIVLPNGVVRWVHAQAEIERGPGGEARLVGVVQDITERKLAEEALRESEASYKALLGAIPDLMFRMDREGNYLDYHAPDPSRLIAPPEQFLRRNVKDVFTGPLRDRGEMCLAALERLFETGLPQMYEYESRRTGRRTWWEVRVVQGRPGEALLLLRDVTDRKRAEQRLKESEQRLRLLVENTPLAVIYWNLEFKVTAWNAGAERMFGYGLSESIGKHASFIVPESDRKQVEEVWRGLMARTGGFRSSNKNVRKDGVVIFCEWYNSPLVDAGGNVIGVASIGEDVTEQRRAARRQALMMAELDHRVKNNLATVLSLAEQTGRGAGDYGEFIKTFTGRLKALSMMHSALARAKWQGADVRTLVTQTLEAFGSESAGRVSASGPDVTLGPRGAQAVAMALNELATNAVKYGSLSDAGGTVRVEWWKSEGSGEWGVGGGKGARGGMAHIRWTERGGPRVIEPEKRGFGSELIEGTIPFEVKGSAVLRFEEAGVVCEMEVPVEEEEGGVEEGGGVVI